MSISSKVFLFRATRAVRRTERARRRQLERELASYATDSERLELEAILDRYPADQTHELRSILAQQQLAAARTQRTPGFGRNPPPG